MQCNYDLVLGTEANENPFTSTCTALLYSDYTQCINYCPDMRTMYTETGMLESETHILFLQYKMFSMVQPFRYPLHGSVCILQHSCLVYSYSVHITFEVNVKTISEI